MVRDRDTLVLRHRGRRATARSDLPVYPRSERARTLHEGDAAFGHEPSDAGTDYARLESLDTITVTPSGDILVCEAGGGVNRLIGFTPDAESYVFALHNLPYPLLEEGRPANSRAEVARPTLSPGGKTLFVNVQYPGVTMAVWGAFPEASAERQRQIAKAVPPARLAPHISAELGLAARRHGISDLHAAALHRLGRLTV